MDSNFIRFCLDCLRYGTHPWPKYDLPDLKVLVFRAKLPGMVSLGGTALGFVFYMLCAAFGITALLMTIPVAYDVLKIAGALYLIYLGWKAIRSPSLAF